MTIATGYRCDGMGCGATAVAASDISPDGRPAVPGWLLVQIDYCRQDGSTDDEIAHLCPECAEKLSVAVGLYR